MVMDDVLRLYELARWRPCSHHCRHLVARVVGEPLTLYPQTFHALCHCRMVAKGLVDGCRATRKILILSG